MSRDWTFFLEDIQDACAKIAKYTSELSFEAFRTDEKTYDAVVRNLEIIGEATKSLPDEVLAMMPEVEWGKTIGLRNIIAHAYFGVNDQIIWDVVQNKIPVLKQTVDRLMTGLNKQ